MPSTPTKVRYNMMMPLVCAEHCEHGPLMCCPFPDCPKGTDAEQIEATVPALKSEIYNRITWTDDEEQKSYSWHSGDLPLWFTISRVIWREAARKGLVEKDASKRISTIYHYTGIEGLLGIIENNEFWLSDYAYLNDAEELKYGLRLAKARFQKAAERLPHAADLLRQWGSTIETFDARACIGSFSIDGDSLSQWRAYGPIAIGFEVGPVMFGYNNTVQMRPVIYDPEVQMRLLDLMAHLCASAYAEDQKNEPPDKLAALYDDGTDRLLEMTAFLKHPTFADEREVRMVHVENPRIFARWPEKRAPHRFRVSRGVLAPYVTTRDVVTLPDRYPNAMPINEVVIGPSPHAEVLERGANELLTARGYGSVKVRRSVAPLRS